MKRAAHHRTARFIVYLFSRKLSIYINVINQTDAFTVSVKFCLSESLFHCIYVYRTGSNVIHR